MAVRVSPTETIRAQIHELFEASADGELMGAVEQVARLSVRPTFQSVVEEIICDELGRDRDQRKTGDSPAGYRNGWQQPRTIKTAAGPVQLQRPKLRHALGAVRPAVRHRRGPVERAGDAGGLVLGAGAVGPGRRSDAGRGPR